jgi:hypothetical protein
VFSLLSLVSLRFGMSKRTRSDDESGSDLNVDTDNPEAIEPVVDLLKRAKEEAKKKEVRAKRPDVQLFDEVTIRTKPYYKTSSMSGNEWRLSTEAVAKYKGHVIWEGDMRSAPDSLEAMARAMHTFEFERAREELDTTHLCDQEGCSDAWTHVYQVKNNACQSCGHLRPATDGVIETRPVVRKFCSRHAQRGDCGIDDAQSNYEVLVTPDKQEVGGIPQAETHGEDEQSAEYGGTIAWDEDDYESD